MTRIPTITLPDRPVSRLAPTPSGFLHLGNAVNFLVTWALVRSRKGTLHLRIDDMDGIRFREEVLEDIFFSLEWLGLDWDQGPWGPESFHKSFSLQARREVYRSRLGELVQTGKVYACGCSRSAIRRQSPDGLYPGTCRDRGIVLVPGRHALRLKVAGETRVRVEEEVMDLARTLGDFVVWRKDDQPSYHLASLLEDEGAGMTLIVRGQDLLESTAAQIYLAGCLGFQGFPGARFVHHGLILGPDGAKLSKSRGAHALKDIRETGQGPELAVKTAARFLGLNPDGVSCARDLLRWPEATIRSG